MSIYAPLHKYAPLYAFSECSLDESSRPLMRSNCNAPSLCLTRSLLHTSCCTLDALPLTHEKNRLSSGNRLSPAPPGLLERRVRACTWFTSHAHSSIFLVLHVASLLGNSQQCVLTPVHRCFPSSAQRKERFQAKFHGDSGLRGNGLPVLFCLLTQRSLTNTRETGASLDTPFWMSFTSGHGKKQGFV